MHSKKVLRSIVSLLLLFIFIFTDFLNMQTVSAATLQYFNYNTNTTVNYSGKQVIYTFNGKEVPLSFPGIIIDGIALADSEELFHQELGLSVSVNGTTITISDGTKNIQLTTGSKTARVNGEVKTMSVAPVKLKFGESVKYYVPTRFVAENFGFDYIWVSDINTVHITKTLTFTYDNDLQKYTLDETELTGKAEENPKLKASTVNNTILNSTQPLKYYYEWIAEDGMVHPEQKNLTKVVAYAVENADVVELYGVTRDDINDFIDSGMLIFELKGVLTNMGTQYFSDFSANHINYTLLTALNTNTKLHFMIAPEDEWYFVEKEDCVQVYFINADLSIENLEISSINTQEEPMYPDDKLIIPVPKKLDVSQLQDKDNYLNNNFQIILPGNNLAFYEENMLLNPYPFLEKIDISYDAELNYTIITCTTETICGYQYTLENGYLAITVAAPDEIYDKIIVLDAGHGGYDPGATQGIYLEKNLNFTILNSYAKELFENSDIKVYFTRETDTFITLNDRAKFASKVGADLFISLHMNSFSTAAAQGTEVFYSSSNNKTVESGLRSYLLAKKLVDNISTSLSTKNRGATSANYYVVKYNSVPAVLIELGFMTNSSDLYKLTNTAYQKKAADAIYKSVIEIFETYPTDR